MTICGSLSLGIDHLSEMFMDRQLFRRCSVNTPIAQIAEIYSGILANLGKAGFM
jgi:hypothetical protein